MFISIYIYQKNDGIILDSNYDDDNIWKAMYPVVLFYCWVK